MKNVAFLRGINVSGKHRVPMEELVPLCESLGWKSVRTYLQTGNVMFEASDSPAKLEEALEAILEERLGLRIPVMVRKVETLASLIEQCPLADQAARTPSKVLLYLAKQPISLRAECTLRARANAAEQVFVQTESMWIYFPNGVGTSKLAPAFLDRAVGSFATGRNWKTACTIASLC